jgi:hypothetical protein
VAAVDVTVLGPGAVTPENSYGMSLSSVPSTFQTLARYPLCTTTPLCPEEMGAGMAPFEEFTDC